jgi:hypothetical protein
LQVLKGSDWQESRLLGKRDGLKNRTEDGFASPTTKILVYDIYKPLSDSLGILFSSFTFDRSEARSFYVSPLMKRKLGMM